MNFCAVALALLMDVSNSVDPREYALQRDGVAEVFRSQTMHQVIESMPGGMAVQVTEWADYAETRIGWTVIQTAAESRAFADRVAGLDRSSNLGIYTALTNAMEHGIREMRSVPCEPERMVIDVSGDGVNNVGQSPSTQRDIAQAEGITVNGLVVLEVNQRAFGAPVDQLNSALTNHYREQVLTHDGRLFEAEGYDQFGQAILRKVIFEIASR